MRGRLLAVVVMLCAWCAAPADAIIGGTPATGPYPWMASLQVQEQHICGASLVLPDTVLTAAHCVQDEKPGALSVVLGRTTLSAQDGERIGVKSVEINADYATDPAGGHDIALVRLKRPSEARTVDVVTADQAGLWAPGAPVRVIGWGTAVFAIGPGSDDLMQADIEVIRDDDCAQSYNGIADYGFDPLTMVCAGRPVVGLQDACQGDSGGPLVADAGGRWVLVGTVSQGLGCGFPLFYGVYGRIGGEELQGWLQAHLGTAGAVKDKTRASPSRVRVAVKRVRTTRRGLRVRLEVSAPVTALKVLVKRRGRIVGRGGLPRVERAATVVVRTKAKRVRRARLRITATDAGGHPITHRERIGRR